MAEPATDAWLDHWAECLKDPTPAVITRGMFAEVVTRAIAERAANARLRAALLGVRAKIAAWANGLQGKIKPTEYALLDWSGSDAALYATPVGALASIREAQVGIAWALQIAIDRDLPAAVDLRKTQVALAAHFGQEKSG